MSKLFTKQPMNLEKSSRFKSLDTTYTIKQFLKNSKHQRKALADLDEQLKEMLRNLGSAE